MHGVQHIAKFNERATNQVAVSLACIRMPQYSTDALVTLNSPVWVDAESSSAEATSGHLSELHTAENVTALFDAIVNSFVLRDPSLFE